jgi:heavy metal sensor kinase
VLWQQQLIGMRRVDRELAALTATLANVANDEFEEKAPEPERETLSMVATPGKALAILDDRGRPLASSWNGFAPPVSLPGADAEAHVWSTTTATPWRVRTESHEFGDRHLVMLAATPLADVFRERREAQRAMVIAIPLVLVLSGLGGLWLASVGLRPIASMAARASQMPLAGAEDLGESQRADELGQLARAFNGLVARLRAALQTQRQFMADASHELRTPVSVIRSAADVTLSRDHRDESEYREALAIVNNHGRRISRLVDDMLVLARADAGGYPFHFEDLYLDELLADVRRTVDGVAGERRITIALTGATDVQLHGDEDLLRRLLLNLVLNALRYAVEGTVVTLNLTATATGVEIRVTNEGQAIPDGDRERIFERFVQLDPARRDSGSGLGLPIARWIAEAHGGSLRLAPRARNETTFLVTLMPR